MSESECISESEFDSEYKFDTEFDPDFVSESNSESVCGFNFEQGSALS
jgi:hypothetical protein